MDLIAQEFSNVLGNAKIRANPTQKALPTGSLIIWFSTVTMYFMDRSETTLLGISRNDSMLTIIKI